jgi:hypothetical protein
MIYAQLLIQTVIHAVHFQNGPTGFVWYFVPRQFSVGFGYSRGHIVYWLETATHTYLLHDPR